MGWLPTRTKGRTSDTRTSFPERLLRLGLGVQLGVARHSAKADRLALQDGGRVRLAQEDEAADLDERAAMLADRRPSAMSSSRR